MAMKYDRRLLKFARRMRHEPSPAEQIMWKLLRHHQLAGFRFRRQHPLPPYILDFYCSAARLVVEVDGETHFGQEQYDLDREAHLNDRGLRVMRFWNTQVFDESESVLEAVYAACLEGGRDNPRVRHKLDASGQFRSGTANRPVQLPVHHERCNR
jgi:very-short-patch-repair endonuclease